MALSIAALSRKPLVILKHRLERIQHLAAEIQRECDEAHASAPYSSYLAATLKNMADDDVGISAEIKERLETAQADDDEFPPDTAFNAFQQWNDERRKCV